MLPRAQRKAITLSAPAKGNGSRALPVIQGDPMRLEQVITHLLDNAIKFSPPGSYVSVELDADNEHLRLSIIDEGKGIALEKLAHVFDRFYQGSSGNRKEAAGIGLGLSLVRTIAEMHGGEVSVNSDPDVGTMVCLILPIEDKGRLLHQSMALNSSLAQQFHALIGSLATSQPAG
jgi:signal transduction histidine kinase